MDNMDNNTPLISWTDWNTETKRFVRKTLVCICIIYKYIYRSTTVWRGDVWPLMLHNLTSTSEGRSELPHPVKVRLKELVKGRCGRRWGVGLMGGSVWAEEEGRLNPSPVPAFPLDMTKPHSSQADSLLTVYSQAQSGAQSTHAWRSAGWRRVWSCGVKNNYWLLWTNRVDTDQHH